MVYQTVTKKRHTFITPLAEEVSLYTEYECYTTLAKSEIAKFVNNYRITLLNYIEEHPDNNMIIDNYLNRIIEFSKNINSNLYIDNKDKLEQLLINLDISKISLDEGKQYDDLERITNSFYRLEPSLKNFNIL